MTGLRQKPAPQIEFPAPSGAGMSGARHGEPGLHEHITNTQQGSCK